MWKNASELINFQRYILHITLQSWLLLIEMEIVDQIFNFDHCLIINDSRVRIIPLSSNTNLGNQVCELIGVTQYYLILFIYSEFLFGRTKRNLDLNASALGLNSSIPFRKRIASCSAPLRVVGYTASNGLHFFCVS